MDKATDWLLCVVGRRRFGFQKLESVDQLGRAGS
jgi:hypothetical protein